MTGHQISNRTCEWLSKCTPATCERICAVRSTIKGARILRGTRQTVWVLECGEATVSQTCQDMSYQTPIQPVTNGDMNNVWFLLTVTQTPIQLT